MSKLTATQTRTLALVNELGEVQYNWQVRATTNSMGVRITGADIRALGKLVKLGYLERDENKVTKTYTFRPVAG